MYVFVIVGRVTAPWSTLGRILLSLYPSGKRNCSQGDWTEQTSLRSVGKKGRFPGQRLAQVDIVIINLRNIEEV